MERAASAKGREHFRASHVNSHLGSDGVGTGRITVVEEELNNGADRLAASGAARHGLCREVRRAARDRARLAVALQRTAVGVLLARANARPLPGREAGYTAAQLEELSTEFVPFGQPPRTDNEGAAEDGQHFMHDEDEDEAQLDQDELGLADFFD